MFFNNSGSNIQSIIVLESTGTDFSDKKVYYQVSRSDFNFNRLKFVASSDYNNDGKTDIATFYNYAGNDSTAKQIVFVFESAGNAFKHFNPIFSTTKVTLNLSNFVNVLPGDFNGDGFSDIACIENDTVKDNQRVVVLENNGPELIQKEYLNITRATCDFSNIKTSIAGKFTADNITDIALFYANPALETQSIYVLKPIGSAFLPIENYYSRPKYELSFSEIVSVVSGQFAKEQKVIPTRWKDNKKGAVTFGFDDGYVNAFRYGASYLSQKKLKGTFYVISNVAFDDEVDYANWDTLSYYSKMGHEVCSHTANHKGVGNYTGNDSLALLEALFVESKQNLDSILHQNTLSISYPFGNFNEQSLSEVSRFFLNARSSQDGYNLVTPLDFMALKSKFVDSKTTPAEIDSWLQKTENYNYHVSLMFHNIRTEPFDKDNDSYSYLFQDFKQCVAFAKQRDLWIDTQGSIFKYTKERNGLKMTLYDEYVDSVLVKVDDGLDHAIFNQELTLKIQLPDEWITDSIFVIDSISMKKTAVFYDNDKRYCYVNVIPDNRKLKLVHDADVTTSVNKLDKKKPYSISVFHRDDNTYLTIQGELKAGMRLNMYNLLGERIECWNNVESNIIQLNKSLVINGSYLFTLLVGAGQLLAKCKSVIR